MAASRAAGLPDLYYGRHLPSLVLAARRHVPVIYECHALPNGAARFMERILLAQNSLVRIVLISDCLKRDFMQRHPEISEDRLVVLHDAAALPTPDVAFDPKWPGRPGQPQVGYVGSLYRGKGAEIVIEIAAAMPEADFHIIGGSDEEIRRLRGKGQSNNLHFHGFVPHQDLTAYYRKLDIALLPLQRRSLDRGGQNIARWTSPLKLFEYMAHGLPVVASDLDVLKEVVTNNETAVLVPANDVGAWRQALIGLICDTAQRRAIANSGFCLVKSRHTWQQRAQDVLANLPV